jgi:hypothetical protein
MANSAAEMERLAQMIRSVEAAIFDGAAPGKDLHGTLAGELHLLDFALQTLTELTGVFDRLGKACPMDLVVDAPTVLGPVRLALLRQALARSLQAEQPHDIGPVEKIELF